MPDIDIEWLQPDGRGGGRTDDGRVARVDGAVPGDRVRVRFEGRDAVLDELLVSSPDRRTPPCPWDADCGGCDLSALAPDAQRAALARTVQRAFRADTPPPLVPSPRPTGHRARVKLAVDGGRLGYRARRSHTLVEVGTCAVARPELQAAMASVRAWLAEDPHRGEILDHVELRSDGQRAVIAFASSGPVPPETRRAMATLGDVALDGKPVSGDPRLWLTVLGHRLRASPRAFFQVNLEANEALVAHVRRHVLDLRAERVLDLYSGIGNLGLPIAAEGVPVVAVEREGQAMEDLRVSADAAGLSDRIRAVPRAVERFDASREAFDVAVLDPPRAGAPGIVDRLLHNRPRALVYVSCNPPTAARDLRPALASGYRLVDLTCFDLFPDTHHVEAVAVVAR